MKEMDDIDMGQYQYSKTIDSIPDPDHAVSVGCEAACPYIGKEFDDNWGLKDPTGKDDETFRHIIRTIEQKVSEPDLRDPAFFIASPPSEVSWTHTRKEPLYA